MSDKSPGRKRAVRGSWVLTPDDFPPTPLQFERRFTPTQWKLLCLGSQPEGMDDKWFIFEEEGRIHFIRSWSGHLLYDVRFVIDEHGAAPTQSFVRIEPQYLSPARLAYHAAMVGWLIDRFLLGDENADLPDFPD